MKVGELIAALSRLDPEMRVVMWQEDEPPGDYEVRGVDVRSMCHSDTYEPSWSVWCSASDRGRRDDDPVNVAFLSPEKPRMPVVDADVVYAALPVGRE